LAYQKPSVSPNNDHPIYQFCTTALAFLAAGDDLFHGQGVPEAVSSFLVNVPLVKPGWGHLENGGFWW
jgi:hypothetical protein